jgi:hypothetical protein
LLALLMPLPPWTYFPFFACLLPNRAI